MLRIMDNRELSIEKINSLRSVHFYHIYKDDQSIPAVMIYYDKDKVLNLCLLDEFYEKLLQKIWEVYEQEKDKNLIIIDEPSKWILENALLGDTKDYSEMIQNCTKIDEAVYNHRGYMNEIVLPVVKYLIEQLYGLTKQNILWNPVFRDWFGNGELSATIGDSRQVFPYKILCIREGIYEVEIGNVLTKSNKLTVSIAYKKSGVEIVLKSDKYKIDGSIKYILDHELVCIADISIDDKQVYTCAQKQECTPAKTDLTKQMANVFGDKPYSEYILPWGQTFVFTYEDGSYGDVVTTDGISAFVVKSDLSEYAYVMSYHDTVSKDKLNYTIYNYGIDIYKRGDNSRQLHFCEMGYSARGCYKSAIAGDYYITED